MVSLESAGSEVAGMKKHQEFFEKLFHLSLDGMNIGYAADDVKNSGEEYILNYVKQYLKTLNEPIIIFDIGANIGGYTQLVLDIFKDIDFRIFSFEPSTETFNKLKKNLPKTNKIELYNMGLGDQNTKMTLLYNKDYSGMSSLYDRRLDDCGLSLDHKEKVKLIKLDDFCDNKMINKIDFLKIDTEGHELKVLEGAKEIIDKDAVKFIQFEFGGCNIDSKTYFQDFYRFLNEKYKIYRIIKNGLYHIDRYSGFLELFHTTNFLAIHNNLMLMGEKPIGKTN